MKKKVLLITGASGIAAATIKLALLRQAKVIYISKTETSCLALRDELEKMKLFAEYIVGDLTDSNVVVNFVRECLHKYGRIDALFNVAGISGRKFGDGPAHECTDEGWAVTMKTNVDTQYRMCREVLNVMLNQQPDKNGLRGTILNMASVLGLSPEPRFFSTIAYAASKGAILSMTKTMASYYASFGIRVNAIAPGLVATKMSERANSDKKITEFIKHKQPLTGSIMQTNDIAESAIFLLSDQSKVITGETLLADAGWSVS